MSLVKFKVGNKIYEGISSATDLAHKVSNNTFEFFITHDSKRKFLSMLYVISRERPVRVELFIGKRCCGLCEGGDIREVSADVAFEDFELESRHDFRIPIPKGPSYKKYKTVMFGREGAINRRDGLETESYFFPFNIRYYMNIRVRVTLGRPTDHCSLVFEEFSKHRKKIRDVVSLLGDKIEVYRFTGGEIGSPPVAVSDEIKKKYGDLIKNDRE